MIIQRKEHIPLPRAMFRLDFTMECVEPVLDFQHEDIAARELTERIASPAQYMSYTVKDSPLPKDTKGDVTDVFLPIPQIEVTVFDGMQNFVIRHVTLDRITRRKQGGVAGALQRIYMNSSLEHCACIVRVNPVPPEENRMCYEQDVVDRLFSSMDLVFESADPWTYHLSDANLRRERKFTHVYDSLMLLCGQNEL